MIATQVRNNIMVALTDMTVQYTVLVDAHIPRLAACLADPNELVRRQALALLASLLSRVCQLLSSAALCAAACRGCHQSDRACAWPPCLQVAAS